MWPRSAHLPGCAGIHYPASRAGKGSLMKAAPVDLQLSSGSLRVLRVGADHDAPVVCVPGLSANARSFDAVSAILAQRGRQVVALDLRGRGFSPATAAGTYGWRHHAKDVLEAAERLGF